MTDQLSLRDAAWEAAESSASGPVTCLELGSPTSPDGHLTARLDPRFIRLRRIRDEVTVLPDRAFKQLIGAVDDLLERLSAHADAATDPCREHSEAWPCHIAVAMFGCSRPHTADTDA